MAPLPRAYCWLSSDAYLNHKELLNVELGRDGEVQAEDRPRVFSAGCGQFIGPTDPIRCASDDLGIDFEAQIAVITSDLDIESDAEHAVSSIRLLVLANAVTLRSFMSQDLSSGLGWSHSKSVTAFSPVAVTPDELEGHWQDGKLSGTVASTWNGRRVGMCETGLDMSFGFGEILSQAAQTKHIQAGSVISSGAVSNKGLVREGRKSWPKGYNCIAEKRAIEYIQDGKVSTNYMKFGDTIRIELKLPQGQSVFGAIDQRVAPLVDPVVEPVADDQLAQPAHTPDSQETIDQ
jgi:fumarylacetoacetate (FAA) hydrolase